jgi:hypothetical protein
LHSSTWATKNRLSLTEANLHFSTEEIVTKTEKAFHIEDRKASAAHYAAYGKACKDRADVHRERSKSLELTDPSGSEMHSQLADGEMAKAEACAAEGSRQLDCCKAVEAMPADEDRPNEKVVQPGEAAEAIATLAKLLGVTVVPTSVRTIPTQDAPRSTLVPRPGASPNMAEISRVDASLQHLIHDASQAS